MYSVFGLSNNHRGGKYNKSKNSKKRKTSYGAAYDSDADNSGDVESSLDSSNISDVDDSGDVDSSLDTSKNYPSEVKTREKKHPEDYDDKHSEDFDIKTNDSEVSEITEAKNMAKLYKDLFGDKSPETVKNDQFKIMHDIDEKNRKEAQKKAEEAENRAKEEAAKAKKEREKAEAALKAQKNAQSERDYLNEAHKRERNLRQVYEIFGAPKSPVVSLSRSPYSIFGSPEKNTLIAENMMLKELKNKRDLEKENDIIKYELFKPKSLQKKSSKSPRRRKSKSPKHNKSKSPRRRKSKSPKHNKSKSPRRRKSKSPKSKSPRRRKSKSPKRNK